MDSLASIFTTWSLGLAVLLILQYLVFLYAYRRRRIDFIDVFWGPSFVLVGLVYIAMNLSNLNTATIIAFLCIAIWGLRIFSHIFARFRSKREQDGRYTEITKSYIDNPFRVYVRVFASQALLASLVMVVFL